MGGKAFASGPDPLYTPRLTPDLYFAILEQTLARLRTLYIHVASPPPAPAKWSHGDIDILVCSPKVHPPPTPADITSLLNSARTISPGPGRSYAIPHPEIEDAYVQVDISNRPDFESWKWDIFHHAFGDLWNLLGTTVRPFGLTANDKGLNVRIQEIEAANKKQSLIFLTREPVEVCRFLGLDEQRLGIDEEGVVRGGDGENGVGFGDMEDMYEFVCGSRMFRKDHYIRHTLKANDRKRMKQREGYSTFLDVWLTFYPGNGGDVELTREKIWDEALERFGVRTVYEERISIWRKEQEQMEKNKEDKAERIRMMQDEAAYADAWIEWLKNVDG